MNVTLKAVQQFMSMVSQCPKSENWGIRVSTDSVVSSPIIRYTPCATHNEGDTIISVEGITFFLDAATACLLSGGIIDHNANGFTTNYIGQEVRCCK